MRDVQIRITKETAKIIAFVVLYLIILGVFLIYVAKPLYDGIDKVNAEITKQEERLALLKVAKEKINIINKDIEEFTNRIETLKTTILQVEPDELLYAQEFILKANQTNVKIASMSFPKASSKTQQNLKPFSITVNAKELQNIRWFLDGIRLFPQITEIEKLSITKAAPSTKATTAETEELPYSARIDGILYLSQRK